MELEILHNKIFKHHRISQMKKYLQQQRQHNKASHQYIQILTIQDLETQPYHR